MDLADASRKILRIFADFVRISGLVQLHYTLLPIFMHSVLNGNQKWKGVVLLVWCSQTLLSQSISTFCSAGFSAPQSVSQSTLGTRLVLDRADHHGHTRHLHQSPVSVSWALWRAWLSWGLARSHPWSTIWTTSMVSASTRDVTLDRSSQPGLTTQGSSERGYCHFSSEDSWQCQRERRGAECGQWLGQECWDVDTVQLF